MLHAHARVIFKSNAGAVPLTIGTVFGMYSVFHNQANLCDGKKMEP
jgi:hypothetical protein